MSSVSLYGVNNYRPPIGYNIPDDDTEPPQASSDEQQKPGWPITIDARCNSLIAADLDGDGFDEVAATSANGVTYVFSFDAQEVSQKTIFQNNVETQLAAGDINNDGKLELGQTDGWNNFYIFDYLGHDIYGWHKTFTFICTDLMNGATFARVDNNNSLDIILGTLDTDINNLHVFHGDGSELLGFPLNAINCTTPTVTDLYSNGQQELLVATGDWSTTSQNITAINNQGVQLWQYDITTNISVDPVKRPLIAADLNNDSYPEIIGNNVISLFVLDHQYGLPIAPTWPYISTEGRILYNNAIVGDIDNNGLLEFVETETYTNKVFGWNYGGSSPPSFPFYRLGVGRSLCALGDTDGDDSPEIVCPMGAPAPGIGGWNGDGTDALGFPLTTDSPVTSGVVIGDFDKDNYVDIAAGTENGKIYLWSLPYLYDETDMTANPWTTFQHDNGNTGNYTTDKLPPKINNSAAAAPFYVGQAIAVTADASDLNGGAVSKGQLCYVAIASPETFCNDPARWPTDFNCNNPMTKVSPIDDLWEGIIPGTAVTYKGLAFYLVFHDNSLLVNPSFDPPGAPEAGPCYSISPADIQDDVPPKIVHDEITQAPVYVDLGIIAIIEDNSGAAPSATLYYRIPGTGSWQAITMSHSGINYSAIIPGPQVTMDELEYQIEAIDWKGNVSTTPVYPIDVYDDVYPTIVHTPITEIEYGDDLNITATIIDNVLISDTELCYRAAGLTNFTCQPMVNTSGTTYEASVPAAGIPDEGGDYYLFAADSSGNIATAPPGAPGDHYTFTVTGVPDDDTDDDTVDDDSTPDDDTTPIDDDNDDDDNDTADDDTAPPVNRHPPEEDNNCCGC